MSTARLLHTDKAKVNQCDNQLSTRTSTAFDRGKYSLWPSEPDSAVYGAVSCRVLLDQRQLTLTFGPPLPFLSGIWQGTFGTATGTSGVRRQSHRIATKAGCTSLAIWLKACCRHSFASHGVNAARWSRALLQACHAMLLPLPVFLLARAFCAFSRA